MSSEVREPIHTVEFGSGRVCEVGDSTWGWTERKERGDGPRGRGERMDRE